MKIAVYAISLNEEKHIRRFCESCKLADYVIIGDTGSSDKTVEYAKKYPNVTVHDISIRPWRFDRARDAVLALVPKDVDVCVSLDIDEYLTPHWRSILEQRWKPTTTRFEYLYNWGSGNTFIADKVHSRYGYYWKNPCHEMLVADPRLPEKRASTEKLFIIHEPDHTKSRKQYLELLRVGHQEDPHDPRMLLYYARELFYHGHHRKSEQHISKFLEIKDTAQHERSYAMRFKAKCHAYLDEPDAAMYWFRSACAECPGMRDPWVDYAQYCYETERWRECNMAAMTALGIGERPALYTSGAEPWGWQPHDLAAISAYYIGDFALAVDQGTKALRHAPRDDRLLANLEVYNNAVL